MLNTIFKNIRQSPLIASRYGKKSRKLRVTMKIRRNAKKSEFFYNSLKEMKKTKFFESQIFFFILTKFKFSKIKN